MEVTRLQPESYGYPVWRTGSFSPIMAPPPLPREGEHAL
jgi:hypothetical protein